MVGDISRVQIEKSPVRNQGAGAAGPFTVDVPGEGSSQIAGLAPGESATRTYRTNCEEPPQEAIADSLGQVAETDETNNSRTYDAVCLT